jgi:hypothetical protein
MGTATSAMITGPHIAAGTETREAEPRSSQDAASITGTCTARRRTHNAPAPLHRTFAPSYISDAPTSRDGRMMQPAARGIVQCPGGTTTQLPMESPTSPSLPPTTTRTTTWPARLLVSWSSVLQATRRLSWPRSPFTTATFRTSARQQSEHAAMTPGHAPLRSLVRPATLRPSSTSTPV